MIFSSRETGAASFTVHNGTDRTELLYRKLNYLMEATQETVVPAIC